MPQARFRLSESLLEFLSRYRQYGFENRSAMVQAALAQMQLAYEQHQLRESAVLYAGVYAEDVELQELAHCALNGWPE